MSKFVIEVDDDYSTGKMDAMTMISLLEDYDPEELEEMFGTDDVSDIVMEYTLSDALDIMCAYDEEDHDIEVGDEVKFDGKRGIVTAVDEDGQCLGLAGGDSVFCWDIDDVEKTGRHFDEMRVLLEALDAED